MKLVQCANCGQSINPKRDVCPFCNTPVVKGMRPAPAAAAPQAAAAPAAGAPAAPEPPARAGTATATHPVATVIPVPWWKRPMVFIPAIVGVVVVVALVAALAVALPKYRASQEKKEAKAAAAKVVAPFVKLDSGLGVGTNYQDYTRMVRDAQYALDAYKPAETDKLGFYVKLSLDAAAMSYQVALDEWTTGLDTSYGVDLAMPDIQKLWDGASTQVDYAKGFVDNGLPPAFEKAVPTAAPSI